MLNETLNQPYLLLTFLIVGLIGGLIFDIGNFIKFLCSNKKIPSVCIDIVQTSLCLTLILFTNLYFNYGLIRLFPIVCFLTSFSVERFTLGKLIAKIYNACYNGLTKLKEKIWRKVKNAKTNKNH